MFRSIAFLCAAFVLSPLAAEGQEGTIKRLGTADGGKVDDIAAMAMRQGETGDVVTAVRAGGELRLIAWNVTKGGKIERLGTADAGKVDEIAIVTLPKGDQSHRDDLITAVRAGGELRLIAWDVTKEGNIARLGTADGGKVDRISAVVLRKDGGTGAREKVVTAVRTGGDLRVIVWDVTKEGKIERVGHADAGGVDDIAAVALNKPGKDHKGDLVTAVRTGGILRLIAWDVTEGGKKIERLGYADAGKVDHIAAVLLPRRDGTGDRDKVITAVRTDGHMHVTAWDVTKEGKIERLGTAEAGKVDDIAAVALRRGDRDQVITAVRAGGELRLISWHVLDGGRKIERLGTADAGKVDRIAIVALPMPEKGDVVTAVRTGGILRLIAWDVSGGGKR